MQKTYQSGRLVFQTMDPMTEAKRRISLNQLTEEAAEAEISAVRGALSTLVNDPITQTQAVITYQYHEA